MAHVLNEMVFEPLFSPEGEQRQFSVLPGGRCVRSNKRRGGDRKDAVKNWNRHQERLERRELRERRAKLAAAE